MRSRLQLPQSCILCSKAFGTVWSVAGLYRPQNYVHLNALFWERIDQLDYWPNDSLRGWFRSAQPGVQRTRVDGYMPVPLHTSMLAHSQLFGLYLSIYDARLRMLTLEIYKGLTRWKQSLRIRSCS